MLRKILISAVSCVSFLVFLKAEGSPRWNNGDKGAPRYCAAKVDPTMPIMIRFKTILKDFNITINPRCRISLCGDRVLDTRRKPRKEVRCNPDSKKHLLTASQNLYLNSVGRDAFTITNSGRIILTLETNDNWPSRVLKWSQKGSPDKQISGTLRISLADLTDTNRNRVKNLTVQQKKKLIERLSDALRRDAPFSLESITCFK